MANLSPLLKQATPVVVARGEGVYLYDEDDRRYLDFTAGIGVTSTGHCHPRVVATMQRFARNPNADPAFWQPAKLLVEAAKQGKWPK